MPTVDSIKGTAACVLIVQKGTGKVLLATRRNSTQVCIPGGKKEARETYREAAIREIMEETGLDISGAAMTHLHVGVDDTGYLTQCYICCYDEKMGVPRQMEEGIMIRWGSSQELIDNSPYELYNLKALHEARVAIELLINMP